MVTMRSDMVTTAELDAKLATQTAELHAELAALTAEMVTRLDKIDTRLEEVAASGADGAAQATSAKHVATSVGGAVVAAFVCFTCSKMGGRAAELTTEPFVVALVMVVAAGVSGYVAPTLEIMLGVVKVKLAGNKVDAAGASSSAAGTERAAVAA